jgi:hypothetical protein
MTVEIESTMTSVKRFDEKEWEVNVFLKEKRAMFGKNTMYLISLTDAALKETNDTPLMELSAVKQNSLKSGSDL